MLIKSMPILLTVALNVCIAADHPTSDANYEKIIKEICKENSAPVKRAQGTKVFSWTDDKGQVHFGDRPPANVQAQSESLQGRKEYFEMSVSFPNGIEQPEMSDALQVNGRAIASAIGHLIPADRMTKSNIEMVVFNNRAAFINYKQVKAPSLSNNVDGFYSALDNSVSIWHDGDDDYAQQIALHEATHVFQYKNIGMMPGWLTEGMADYFASLRVKGNAKVVSVNPYWLGYLQQQRQVLPLAHLLTASYDNFQSARGADYYSNSWALFYFLMLPEHRAMVALYLAELSEDKCDEMPSTHSLTFFEIHYPGGVQRMQSDWLEWISSNHSVPNYH